MLFCLFQGSDSCRFYPGKLDIAQTLEKVFIQLICLDVLENRQIRFADEDVHGTFSLIKENAHPLEFTKQSIGRGVIVLGSFVVGSLLGSLAAYLWIN